MCGWMYVRMNGCLKLDVSMYVCMYVRMVCFVRLCGVLFCNVMLCDFM